jgi:hypothetical protein
MNEMSFERRLLSAFTAFPAAIKFLAEAFRVFRVHSLETESVSLRGSPRSWIRRPLPRISNAQDRIRRPNGSRPFLYRMTHRLQSSDFTFIECALFVIQHIR